MLINAPFNGPIADNTIHHSGTGVGYHARAALVGNDIHDNGTGIDSDVDSATDGLGFVDMSRPNHIHANTTGVQLDGRMQNQFIEGNTTGVAGSGLLGGDTFDTANRIERNTLGVDFDGTIQFNRIGENQTGVHPRSGQLIAHNVFYRNTQTALEISGLNTLQVISNTFYAVEGDNIRVEDISSNIEIRDNILWAEQGYDIYVANDSQNGYFSDFNTLHAGPTGKIFYWTKDFNDILDLQADVARFELHSVGRTVVHPDWSEPRFLNLAQDDYRVFDLVAGQRFSSPSVDNADPLTDKGLPASYQNLLTNAGFESGVSDWKTSLGATTRSNSPAPYEGSNYFFSGGIAEGFAEQTVDLLAAGYSTAQLDSQDLVIVYGGRVRSLSESPIDEGMITLTFLDADGVQVGSTVGLAEASNTTTRWELIGGRRVIPAGTRQVKYRFQADRQNGTSNDSYLDSAFLYAMNESVVPDQGAYGNTSAEDAAPVTPHIALRSPDLYLDWERDKPRSIRWESYSNDFGGLESNVRIDLYQDGPGGPEFLLNITTSTADDGDFTWIPSTSGIGFGTYGLRIQVSYTLDPSVYDRSTESFTVPESGNVYWVDDASNTDDEYTPGAVGSNRNTGKLATAPKPNPVNVLRVYEVSGGATMNIDRGVYPLIDTITLSAVPGVGLGTDRGFLMRGPTDTAKTAELVPAIPNNASQTLIDMVDADLMQIRFLTLTGGRYGLHANSGSTGLTAEGLTVRDNADHGILIENGSDFTILKDITTINHAGNADGLHIAGGAGGVIENLISNNNHYGLYTSGLTHVDDHGGSGRLQPQRRDVPERFEREHADPGRRRSRQLRPRHPDGQRHDPGQPGSRQHRHRHRRRHARAGERAGLRQHRWRRAERRLDHRQPDLRQRRQGNPRPHPRDHRPGQHDRLERLRPLFVDLLLR